MSAPNAGQNMTAQSMPGQGVALPLAGSGNSKKIHTVAIHPGQDDADAAAPQAPTASAPAHGQAARPAAPKPVAAPPQGGNGPLSIVPSQSGATPDTSRTRTAVARPTVPAEAAPSAAGGGYSVQVSSHKSEAEAQSAYRDLQAKYPNQLGGRTPSVRRVDLGAKGVYWRNLVGPFASMDQAASMCSSLKAAGHDCIVQRN